MTKKRNDVPLTVFIGFDERQAEAFEICKQSILDTASGPVEIIKLDHKSLRQQGVFTREWMILKDGTYKDVLDEKPFSTQFSHSRFLVPHLSKGKAPFTVFVDSDFVFLTDIYELVQHCATGKKRFPVYCVKHNYTPTNEKKMDNCVQTAYNMKLWTSLMVFDNREFALQNLTPEKVNTAPGLWLHQFKWLGAYPVDEIGEIPESWNHIPGHSPCSVSSIMEEGKINAIHFTEGTPHMAGYETSDFSQDYWTVYKKVLQERLNALS